MNTSNSFSKQMLLETNKRPMGHIIHLRNQFKPINTFAQSYDSTTTLIWIEKV